MITLRTFARRPSVALVTLLLAVYAYFYQAGGWNQNSRFDLVRAVVEERSLRIDRWEKNTGDDSIRDGHWYCDKAPGASLLCMPTWAVVYCAAGAPAQPSPSLVAWGAWAAIVLAVGVPSAIAAAFLARLARLLGLGPRMAIAVALAWGLGSMALPYATLLYGNQLAANLTLIAFTLLVEIGEDRKSPPSRMLAVGALLGFAGATEYPAMMIAMGIGVYSLTVVGLRSSLWAIAGAAIPLSALLLYHRVAFGSPFAFPYDYSVWKEPRTGWFMGIGKPVPASLQRILFGNRGLLYTTPWLALAAPGAFVLARRHRKEVFLCVWAIVSFLWLSSSLPQTAGGWAPGPRYLVPMLPFAAALAGGALLEIAGWLEDEERATRIVGKAGALVIGGVVAISIANMFAATAVKPEIDLRWEKPYADLVWPSFRAGKLAVSTQSIDMIDNPEGAPRQAWNLGMKMGLDGQTSLIPLYIFVVGCGVWLAWTLRRRPA